MPNHAMRLHGQTHVGSLHVRANSLLRWLIFRPKFRSECIDEMPQSCGVDINFGSRNVCGYERRSCSSYAV